MDEGWAVRRGVGVKDDAMMQRQPRVTYVCMHVYTYVTQRKRWMRGIATGKMKHVCMHCDYIAASTGVLIPPINPDRGAVAAVGMRVQERGAHHDAAIPDEEVCSPRLLQKTPHLFGGVDTLRRTHSLPATTAWASGGLRTAHRPKRQRRGVPYSATLGQIAPHTRTASTGGEGLAEHAGIARGGVRGGVHDMGCVLGLARRDVPRKPSHLLAV